MNLLMLLKRYKMARIYYSDKEGDYFIQKFKRLEKKIKKDSEITCSYCKLHDMGCLRGKYFRPNGGGITSLCQNYFIYFYVAI